MKNSDKISASILFVFALFVCIKSFQYPMGSFQLPGAGLFPLLASLLLIVLSGSIVLSSFLTETSEHAKEIRFFPSKETPQRIGLALISLIAYRYLLPIIGFAPTTFIFILLLGRYLARYSWRVNFLFSGTTAFVSYYLFQLFLKIPLPKGIFGI